MNLKRILQLALTSFLGQGVSIITQLLVPPFFLRFYPSGIEVYGEWIALSASINYLGTLNYGIQTYANNQMTILYNGGDREGAKEIQASALRVLLLLIMAFVVLGLAVLFLPIADWLRLRHINSHQAGITLYLLIVQMAVAMIFSLLSNSYMVVGLLHRGNYWSDGQRLFTVLGMSFAIYRQASFPVLAAVQLGSLLLFGFLMLIDVRRTAPILLPSLRYGTWKQTRAILAPSGHFGLIAIGGFLTWQGPIILIQRLLGPGAVAVFSLVRVVFQMSRQILSVASGMISQDITMLFGKRDWPTLRRLYDLSERVVLFLIPIVSVGSLLMCPFLFTIWLHKRNLYEPTLCLLMAIVSGVLGIKEHKTQFQSSSNNHERLSFLVVGGYTAMLLVAIFTTKAFGLVGFMVTWIIWEIIQTTLVVRLNAKLFPSELNVSMNPMIRLLIFMVAAYGLAAWPSYRAINWSLPLVVAVAVALTSVLAVGAYFAFGLQEIVILVRRRLRRRFNPLDSMGV